MAANGLKNFTFHTADFAEELLLDFKLEKEIAFGYTNSAEWAARTYLQRALDAKKIPEFTAPQLIDGSRMSLRLKRIDEQPLTGNKVLKFRQRINNISVYGSQVLVELDPVNNLISLDARMSKVQTSESWAAISPLQAKEIAQQKYKIAKWPKDSIPFLYHYYSEKDKSWKLVYLLKDLVVNTEIREGVPTHSHHLPEVLDLIINAKTGEIIAQLPRIACLRELAEGHDEQGVWQNFPVYKQPDGARVMKDDKLRVMTYDFQFRSVSYDQALLPGEIIGNPPDWKKSGVSAHQNTRKVAAFFKNVLKREGIDNKGMPYVSSVNCINLGGTTEWKNAAWFNGQIVYGQEKTVSGYRSYASALDIVAHEITHGLTDNISRLEYQGESGALNESYSDIFGVIISNWEEPDISEWDWRMGEELSLDDLPLRDISNPKLYGQPDHMTTYEEKDESQGSEHGGIHQNCGIHNKAAYLLMSTQDEQGQYLFTKEEIAYLFYLSLTKLAAQDGFLESLNSLVSSAKSLFMKEPDKQQRVLLAIDTAFQQVGIA